MFFTLFTLSLVLIVVASYSRDATNYLAIEQAIPREFPNYPSLIDISRQLREDEYQRYVRQPRVIE